VKKEFVPDEFFSWDLDLESLSKSKKKKKPKTLIGAAVITHKQNQDETRLNANLTLKLKEGVEFSMTSLNKANKGLTNTKNSCYLNVCLQSLMATPPFFNMLKALSDNEAIL
jgi:ubiquitin C-terminal hydrolase